MENSKRNLEHPNQLAAHMFDQTRNLLALNYFVETPKGWMDSIVIIPMPPNANKCVITGSYTTNSYEVICKLYYESIAKIMAQIVRLNTFWLGNSYTSSSLVDNLNLHR